ncbi:MAG: tetratricopeptide repeat protein [Magnetococcales bacterium]|nr:tetratricopeptide repeat protein [Magnetococcales bacterium]
MPSSSVRPLPRRVGKIRVGSSPLMVAVLIVLFLMGSGSAAGREKKSLRLISDPETSDFLDTLGKPLTQRAGLDPEDVHFHVILKSDLNAMALPNRHIVFNSGLLLQAEDQTEVAAVMAHEIAHLVAGHHAQLKSAAESASIRAMILTALGVTAGIATGNSDLAQAAVTGGSAAIQASMLGLLRQKEMQADRLAIHYLIRTGFDPRGMADFLERVARDQRMTSLPAPYLMSHPVTSHRLSEARAQAESLPSIQKPISEAERESFLRVRAKLIAGGGADPGAAVALFQKRLDQKGALDQESEPDAAQTFANRYGLALAQFYSGHLEEAVALFDELIALKGADPYLLRERGLVRLEQGRLAAAGADFEAALALKPKEPDLIYRLAFTWSQQGDYETSGRLLRRLISDHPTEARAFYLLGLVEGKQERMGQSHLALARYYGLMMQDPTSIWHYRQAIEHFPKGSAEARIAKAEMARKNKEKKKGG